MFKTHSKLIFSLVNIAIKYLSIFSTITHNRDEDISEILKVYMLTNIKYLILILDLQTLYTIYFFLLKYVLLIGTLKCNFL